MSVNNNSNANPNNSASFSDLYQENKFIKYTARTEDCPICSSNSGKCKRVGALTLCMERGKDDVPESILNRFDFRGLNKTQEWNLWADKEHPDYQGGKGFGTSTNKTKGQQNKKVEEVKRPLSANVLDSLYRGLVKEKGLSDLAKEDIAARGEDPDNYLGFSVNKEVTSQAIKAFGTDAAKLFPGADSLGILRYAGEGYTCPAFNKYGQVIGYQIRYFDSQAKYTWAATNNKIEINSELELPINLAIGDPESKILYFSEGVLKSSIASSRLGLNVLGAAGGNLVASYNQFLENIIGYEQFIWAMDAGAIKNDRVMRQYLRASKVIEAATGIKVQYLWYGQLDKATGNDIDEITHEELASARVISKEELLAISKDNGVDTSLFILETETYESTQEENQETPNNPEQTKKLILTNCKTTYQDLSTGKDTVIYFPQFNTANTTEPFWERNDLPKYSEVEVITRESHNYSPWSDPSGKQPKFLRWWAGHLEKLFGITPIGSTNDERDLKRYLGTIEDEDPYFAYPDKLHVRSKKGNGLIYRNMGEGHTAPKITLRTSKGSLPLGSVAYFGSHLDLPNADRNTEGGFVPALDVINLLRPGSIVGLRAPMGKGKTKAVVQLIKDAEDKFYDNKAKVQVTAFGPTRQLSKNTAKNIDGMEFINDYKQLAGTTQSERDAIKTYVAQLPKISLCLNSAGDLEKREYRETDDQGIPIIFLDEVETMLAGMNDPNSHYDKSKLSIIRREFARAIREATENNGYVLVADANVQDITLRTLAEFAGVDPSKIIRINHKNTDPGFKYTYCDDISKIRGKIYEMLEEGKKLAVFCDSKRELEQIEQECWDRGLKGIFVMHGDNIAAPKYDGFIENPDQWMEDNTPTLFGFNSVIGEGVSIHYGGFDAMFIIPKGVLTPNSIRQGSLRLRDLTIPRYIFANKSRNSDPPAFEYKPSEIRDEVQEGITETLASLGITTTPEINRQLSQHNPLLGLHSLKLAKDKYQQFGYWKAIEGGLLIAQNCTPFEVAWTKDASHKEVEKELQKRDSIYVEEAIALPKDSPAFKQLDAKAYKTHRERAQWLKSITADTLPGVELERWFAKDYMVTTKGRNNLKRIKTLGDTLFCDISLAIAKNYVQKRVEDMLNGTKDSLLFTEIKKNTRQVAALNRLGVPAVAEQFILAAVEDASIDSKTNKAYLPEKIVLSMDNEAINHLLSKFTKDLTPNCKALGLRIKHGTKRIEKLKRIMKLVGFTKIREGVDNTVIITLPFKLLDILVAHRQTLIARYDQLVAEGKMPDKYSRQDSGESPTESLLAKVSEFCEDDIELLKIEVKNLFGLRKLIGEAKNNTTPVIAGSEPPKLSSS